MTALVADFGLARVFQPMEEPLERDSSCGKDGLLHPRKASKRRFGLSDLRTFAASVS